MSGFWIGSKSPKKNIPSAISMAILVATLVYVVLAMGAITTIPTEIIIRDKEFALAAGASNILGDIGFITVMTGALFATSSAINGTIFGASRLIAVIASDGVFPRFLEKRRKHIPQNAIILMSALKPLLNSGSFLCNNRDNQRPIWPKKNIHPS